MFAVLFPDGLKFTRLPYKQEWAEANAKIDRITSEGYDTEIAKLGGKPILDHLLAAHKAYGESLGITAEGQDPNIVGVREPLSAFSRYLRAYVVAVTAHTDPDDAASGTLADTLLAPLHKWQTYVTVAAPEATGTTGTTGTTTPGTTSAAQTPGATPAAQAPASPTSAAPTNGSGAEPAQH